MRGLESAQLRLLLDLVESYLTSSISGLELVKAINNMVGDDVVQQFPEEIREIVDRFQNELAFYVRDERTQSEAPGVYFGEEELRVRAMSFQNELLGISG